MKRIIVALALSGMVFGAVYALAATLTVGGGTAASGTGDVDPCGNVTGSTYILVGQAISASGQDDIVMGDPTDVDHVQAVNIETDGPCDEINAFVAVKNGAGAVLATGSCVIEDADPAGDDIDSDGFNDGLGFDEAGASDNVAGCTAVLSGTPNVADIEFLTVTMT